MKKVFVLIFAIILVLNLPACTKDKYNIASTSENTAEETSSTSSTVAVSSENQSQDTDSKVEEKFTYAIEKTIKNTYILSTKHPNNLNDFIVERKLNADENSGLNSLLSAENIAIKSQNNWVKFLPNRPNEYAIALEFTDNTCMIIAIHFTGNSNTYYIAIADSDKYDEESDYKDLEYTRCIASEELGKYLYNIIKA